LQGLCVKFDGPRNIIDIAGRSRLGGNFLETRRGTLGGEIVERKEGKKQKKGYSCLNPALTAVVEGLRHNGNGNSNTQN
jgi:hypothetical protein